MLNRQDQFLGSESRKARNISSTLRKLWRYFGSYTLALILVLVLIVAGTGMQVLVPGLTGQVVDCYLGPYAAVNSVATESDTDATVPAAPVVDVAQATDADTAYDNCWFTTPDPLATASDVMAGVGFLVLLIIALYVGNAVLTGISFYAMSWAGYHVLRDLQRDIFDQIQRLSLSYFTKHDSGDVMSRLTNDVDTLQQVVGFGLLSVVQGVLLIVFTIYAMFSLNAPFAVISLLMLPLLVIATRWFSTQARKAFRRARAEIGNVNADLQEGISAVREVQAFGREDENIAQFETSNAANRDANIQAQLFTSALAPSLEALSYVGLAITSVIGGLLIISNQELLGTTISVGLIIAFIGYSQQFSRPVQQIALLWTNIQNAIAGAERIFDLLEVEPDIEDAPAAQTMPPIVGRVVYEDVWAEYNTGEHVLRGIDIIAEPGEMIAIVGPTGAGKTTIINLLPRFWDVTKGQVSLDGIDIRNVTRSSLRSQIGVVLQDTFLFGDTVANNIRYGRPDANQEAVVIAAKLARAHDFIERLPEGYETVLGERGSGLSQGQRQLLSIARIALIDPRILILDEATSSVDTRTEREIQAALEKMLEGRTSFVIAHRLSTIRNASQVLVLDNGQIIEKGTHDELIAARGFYFDLYNSQFRRDVGHSDLDDEPEAFFVPGD